MWLNACAGMYRYVCLCVKSNGIWDNVIIHLAYFNTKTIMGIFTLLYHSQNRKKVKKILNETLE